MSRLRLPEGDDHPDAAHKHLLDAESLLAQQRPDGAAYLSGYVVECALKSLHVLETGRGLREHDFGSLVQQISAVATVAGAKTAKYLGRATRGVLTSAIGGWTPAMRYHAPAMALDDAQRWHACARNVFRETVHQMRLDGVL
ncbi:MAG TPA: HEPN domain-containing protein [Candidatus Binatia bacterium]|nr:HEPN domain-containing protein [Candidatus Binatia bacterium]